MTAPQPSPAAGGIDLDVAERTLHRAAAIDAGLFVAEWAAGGTVLRSYGRTQGEAIARVLAERERAGTLHVTTGPNPAGFGGADWREVRAEPQSDQTFPVSLEATIAEARQLTARLSFLLAVAADGPTAAAGGAS